jgi:hypothetical protein
MVLCLLGWNHDAFGQCPILNGGKIKIEPGSDRICWGDVPKLTVEGATGHSGQIQWKMRTNGDNGTWKDDEWISWTNTPVYDTIQIYGWVSYYDMCYKYSDTVTIIVYGKLDGGTIGSDSSICYNTLPGTLKSLTPASGGDGAFSYQWQWFDGNDWTSVPSGGISEDYDPGNLTATTKYRRMATNIKCGEISSDTITVTVYGELDGGMIATDNSSICSGFSPGILKSLAEASGGNGGFNYQWQYYDGSDWVDISGETLVEYTPPALTATTTYRRKATDATCSTPVYSEVTVTVNPLPATPTLTASSTEICAGESVTLTATATGVAEYSFDGGAWQAGNTTTVTPATTTDYTVIARTSAGCVSAVSGTVTVTVKATPAAPRARGKFDGNLRRRIGNSDGNSHRRCRIQFRRWRVAGGQYNNRYPRNRHGLYCNSANIGGMCFGGQSVGNGNGKSVAGGSDNRSERGVRRLNR